MTVESIQTKTRSLKQGEKLLDTERIQVIMDIRDMIERGASTTKAIIDVYGCDRTTAVSWRNQALELMAKDNNGWTRDALRNVQVGRLNYWIETTSERLKAMAGKEDTKLYSTLMERLTSLSDALARISGLNIETNINMGVTKHIIINRPSQASPSNPILDQSIDTKAKQA